LVFTCLFKFKSPIQFHVRSIFFIVCMASCSFLYLPIAAFRPKNTLNFIWLGNFFKAVVCFFYGLKISVENYHNVESDKPFIVICNHQSVIDVATMVVAWPQNKTTVLGKKELLYTGPVGLTFWLCGMTFIDRFHSDKAKHLVNNLADRLNQENMRVWIYPEGTRNKKTELLPFKKGAFHLAIQAQIPIVCVVASSYSNFYNKKEKKWLSNGEIKVRVLPPVSTIGMTIDDISTFSNDMHDKMQTEFNKLNSEINLDQKYYTSTQPDLNNNEKKME